MFQPSKKTARLATLPYGLDSNVTQLLANMLTKPSVFYCLPIVPCNLVSLLLCWLMCHISKFQPNVVDSCGTYPSSNSMLIHVAHIQVPTPCGIDYSHCTYIQNDSYVVGYSHGTDPTLVVVEASILCAAGALYGPRQKVNWQTKHTLIILFKVLWMTRCIVWF